MKTIINKKELIEFNACKSGFDLFVKAHGDATVKLSQCIVSNSLDDVIWLLSELKQRSLLAPEQIKDLRLFAADCAESVLHIFEGAHPDDNRPRLAIQASRDFANGLINNAAWSAARSAASSAVRYAAISAASDAVSSSQKEKLTYLLLKWEAKGGAE